MLINIVFYFNFKNFNIVNKIFIDFIEFCYFFFGKGFSGFYIKK